MPGRRPLLAGVSALLAVSTAGCLDSITGNTGGGDRSFSEHERRIAEAYADGIETFNAGAEAWDDGVRAFNESNYGSAVAYLEDAVGEFETAETLFVRANERAVTAGQSEAAELCKEAAERAGLMFEASQAAKKAAQVARDDGNTSEVNDYIETAREREEQAAELEIQDTDAMVAALDGESSS